MGTIIFASGMRDAMLRRREHPGASIVRFDRPSETGTPSDPVRQVIETVGTGRTVIIPLTEAAVSGWRAPEGTEVMVTEASISRFGTDSDIINNALMRSPKWAMEHGDPGPGFPPVIGDGPDGTAPEGPAPDPAP